MRACPGRRVTSFGGATERSIRAAGSIIRAAACGFRRVALCHSSRALGVPAGDAALASCVPDAHRATLSPRAELPSGWGMRSSRLSTAERERAPAPIGQGNEVVQAGGTVLGTARSRRPLFYQSRGSETVNAFRASAHVRDPSRLFPSWSTSAARHPESARPSVSPRIGEIRLIRLSKDTSARGPLRPSATALIRATRQRRIGAGVLHGPTRVAGPVSFQKADLTDEPDRLVRAVGLVPRACNGRGT